VRFSVGLLSVLVMFATGCGGDSEPTVSVDVQQADFTGTGTTNIGPVDLPGGAQAEWSNSEGIFFLIALESDPPVANPQLIVSEGQGGTSYVSPGSYVFKVSTFADADWTLDFHAG